MKPPHRLPVARFPSSPTADTFPAPAGALTAVTVFTAYAMPPAPGGTAPSGYIALCCCGEIHCGDSGSLLRKALGRHSCVAVCGRVELVPIDDQPSRETIERVLDGLRALR